MSSWRGSETTAVITCRAGGLQQLMHAAAAAVIMNGVTWLYGGAAAFQHHGRGPG